MISKANITITTQLNHLPTTGSSRYQTYHAIVQEKMPMDKANFNGLYQAFTPITCISEILLKTKNKRAKPKQMAPKMNNGAFLSFNDSINHMAFNYPDWAIS
jgi:hypothetical protein